MTICVTLQNGKGPERQAEVTEDRAIKVTVVEPSASSLSASDLAKLSSRHIYTDAFKNSAGSSDMTVNGSVTPQDFYIAAQEAKLITIDYLRFTIHADGFSLSNREITDFSAAYSGGLVNGWELLATQSGVPTNVFYQPVMNLGELITNCDDYTSVLNGVANGVDLFLGYIKLPEQVVLTPGTKDRLTFRVNDNFSQSEFEKIFATVYGTQESV